MLLSVKQRSEDNDAKAYFIIFFNQLACSDCKLKKLNALSASEAMSLPDRQVLQRDLAAERAAPRRTKAPRIS